MKSYKDFSQNLLFHLENKIPLSENVFRYGSESYFELINEAREFQDMISMSDVDKEILSTDIGKFDTYTEYGVYMESFKPKDLVIFDIDDTLFKTTAKIKIQKGGKTIKKMTPAEFEKYELDYGETANFDEFTDSKMFKDTSIPIEPSMKDILSAIKHSKENNSTVIILTGREDLDNKQNVIDKFREYDIDITKDVHLHRAGNISGITTAEKKAEVVKKYLNTGKYNRAIMYDDLESNLRKFKQLKKNYKDIDFVGNVVIDGKIKTFNEMYIPLDFPFIGFDEQQELSEAQYHGKKVDLDKPKRGGPKKYYVYVKNPKTKKIIKVSFGDVSGLKEKITDPKARKSFVARHQCNLKKDKTTPGYWACRLPWYAKSLGLTGGGKFYW